VLPRRRRAWWCRPPARALKSQRLVLELLQADLPAAALTRHNEVDPGRAAGRGPPRFARAQPAVAADPRTRPSRQPGRLHPVHPLPARLPRRTGQRRDRPGRAGALARIVFDMDDAMGASPAWPAANVCRPAPRARWHRRAARRCSVPDRSVDSVCPYCGVGCQLTYHVKDDRILRVEGRPGPANQGRLCVKGRYGFDYARHPQRLTVPLIRRADAPKDARRRSTRATWRATSARPAGTRRWRWPAARCVHPRHARAQALAGFGSAKGSNEEAYLFQKLVRLGFGSNNVDHCTRLCHASSVAALLEGIGSGAVSNPVLDVQHAEVVIVIGANPTVNHPVAATWIKNAVRQGTQLVVMDPRRGDLARHATHFLQFKPDADVPLLNSMMHVIVEEGLVDRGLHRRAHRGLRRAGRERARLQPERMAPVTGIPRPRCARWRGCTPPAARR
jgi:formate dehydrogenase major subunit